jgi:hypothetical protein
VLLGSALTNIDVALDASDRFEVHAPGASAVVRGTHWWTIVDRDGNTVFVALDGDVELFPHRDDAEPFILDLNSPLWVSPDGTTQPIPGFLPPTFPTETPATCGDGICAEGEACALDCPAPPPTCGNTICDPNEDLVLCAADCGPAPAETCGNGICDGNESDLTCREDCEPGRYFTPARPALCGNSICDPTESNLTCPGDCQSAQSEACMITAANINLREGPGTNYPIVGVLNGERLPVLGQNNGWYVVTHNNSPAWVAARLVDETGPCDDLLWYEAPPTPSNDTVTPETPTTSGGWGACGSCDSCGYPASECVTSPEGQCLWNPRLCRPPDPSSGGGSFSVSPCNVSCLVSTTLVGTFSGTGTISDTNVSSAATWLVFTTTMVSPTQFQVAVQCYGTNIAATPVAITMWDDSGQEYSQTCMVAVQ